MGGLVRVVHWVDLPAAYLLIIIKCRKAYKGGPGTENREQHQVQSTAPQMQLRA